MSDKTRVFFLSLTIVAMLFLSAFGTIPVYADDGTTTGSTDTTTTETPTDDGTTPTDGETPPVDDGTTPPAEQPPAEDVSTLLEQVPDNTTVTVLDEAGEAQPLVTQESADAILTSDPVWCPEGQLPGSADCTQSFSSFTELLGYLETNSGDPLYQQAGTIYVEQGDYQGGEETIDFNSYNLNEQDLTIQGGWNTTDNTISGTSNFTAPIIIGSDGNPWAGSLTINNIFITGVGDQAGLTLYSDGDIALSEVEVTDSLDGANLNAGGNVEVKNSKFNNNGSGVEFSGLKVNVNGAGAGLTIVSGGTVTLQDIEANNNDSYGADIVATGDVNITNGFFTGNVSYTFPPGGSWGHFGYGLQVVTSGNIALTGVTANENQLFGANLDGGSVTINSSYFNHNGSLWNEDPTGYGLKINSSGSVTLEDLEASGNELFGADINAGSSVVIRRSFFNGNSSYEYISGVKTYSGYGLQIVTPADIGLIDVEANENALLGAHLEGSDVIVNTGSFSNNGSGSGLDVIGGGLEVIARGNDDFGDGDVSLNNITADNNQLFGANIIADSDVAIGASEGLTSSFSGTITYIYDTNTGNVLGIGGGYGLQIVAGDNIALQNVNASNNYLFGASLEGVNVAINNGVFSHNGSGVMTSPAVDHLGNTVGYGLKIVSTGTVTLRDIEANYNQLFGADIKATGNVDISASAGRYSYFTGNQAVTLNPLTFYGYGLTVYSDAEITLNQVEANFNNLWGASLDGTNIFVLNSKFNNNISDSTQFIDDTGLIVNSRGEIVFLDNVEARENRLIGVTITAVGDVIIQNSTFTDNAGFTCIQVWCPDGGKIYYGYGLNVVTSGSITLDNVNASNNHLFGAHLEGGNVSVSNSSFNNNRTPDDAPAQGYGLEIISGGTVTINLVEANNNQLFGTNIQAQGDVTVTASDFIGNFHVVDGSNVGYGLQVVTLGNITLNSDNTGYGIQGYQNGSGAILQGASVTVTDSNFYNNTSGNGLTINATGNVTLTNVTATSNGQNGADVTTAACAVVQVTGGTFSENGQYGLSVNGGILNADGTQVFVNNGAGNIFENPASCVIVLTDNTETTVGNNNGTTAPTTTIGTKPEKDNPGIGPKEKPKKKPIRHHKIRKISKGRK